MKRKVLLDSNVVIDLVLKRPGFFENTKEFSDELRQKPLSVVFPLRQLLTFTSSSKVKQLQNTLGRRWNTFIEYYEYCR
jgi:predicted nucleic acid-binding protein